ncbi:hypothetical protein AB0I84_38690 [Streptomyces spectabilis]|uniref:hypothetical protein n=1 Tax=Streptomyces spectabilis TaxID=68270 RepID=UPI0033F4D21D
MPYGTPAPVRLCAYCWGFPVVTVTTGARHRNGTRKTLRVTCPDCNGTGTRGRRVALATVGR